MNKRKTTVSVIAATVMLCFIALLFIYAGKPYKVESGTVIAADLDITSVITAQSQMPEDDIENIVQYYKNNGINTAILLLNSGESSVIEIPGYNYIYIDNDSFSEKDIITRLKKAFAKEKIQLYVSLDCNGIEVSKALDMVEYIHKNYALAGIVINNYEEYTDIITDASGILKKGIRKTDLILQTDDISAINNIFSEAEVDAVIGENMNVHDYSNLKEDYADKKFFFHYNSSSIESDIFVLTNFGNMDGAVVKEYDGLPFDTSLTDAFTDYSELPLFGYTVPDDFIITHPYQDVSTYYDGIFITGTGANDGIVNINGTDYPAQHDGTFGAYISLEPGENILNISSAYGTHTRTVTRKTYSYTSDGGNTWTIPWDDSVKLDKGRVVTTVNALTSVLSNPDDDSSIIGGLEKGTMLKVIKSVETKRNNKKTYAYMLSNGGYVLAANTEVTDYITSDYTPPKKNGKNKKQTSNQTRLELIIRPYISSVYNAYLENGDEVMEFSVNSSPAVFSDFGKNSLTLHFLDTEINDITIPQSGFFSEYSVVQQENGVRLTMSYSNEKQLWGYDISRTENSIKLYLKQAPQKSAGAKPLSGVTVMLDAGHGGNDSGALGVAGTEGVWEDTLNLAVAQAAKALLQEHGANVVMTRDEDIFLELEERRSLVRSVKPDLFISVHHNSMDYSYNSTNARGSECYYFTSQSKNLADTLCSEVARATNRRDRGEKTGYYYVTRTDITPSVLMEYSFIINPQDYSTTYSDIDIYRAAWGTLQAILKVIPQ